MTTKPKPPTPPPGLGRRGGSFWRRVVAGFDLDDAERELLVEVCRSLDTLDSLADVVAAEGHTVAGSRGQRVTHPAVGELRLTRQLVGRLLAQLQLPDEDGVSLSSPTSARARRAAAIRWGHTRGSSA